MQVESKSRKFYENYFDMFETLNTYQGFPFWVSPICVARFFCFLWHNNVSEENNNEKNVSKRYGKGRSKKDYP